MPDRPTPADWPSAWAETWQALQELLAGAGGSYAGAVGTRKTTEAADLRRQIAAFSDDYLGITREFSSLIDACNMGDEAARTQRLREGLERLRDAFKVRYARLYALPGAALPPQGAPPSGFLHGSQARHERLVDATLRWQRALQAWNERLAAVAGEAAERLIVKLTAKEGSPSAVTTLRELHELWVDCGEQAYAAAAHGDEFATAQGELLAAMIEMRFEQRQLVEAWARALDLPARSQVDTISERLHRLQQRVAELERALEPSKEPGA